MPKLFFAKMKGLSKKNSISLILLIAILVLLWNGYPFHRPQKALNHLQKITFQTNGILTSQWLQQQLHISKKANLFYLNTPSICQKLSAYSQIKQVRIEKLYPDILKISIVERIPIAKIVVNIQNQKKLYLLDGEDGTFFSPIGDHHLAHLKPIILEVKWSSSQQTPEFPKLPSPQNLHKFFEEIQKTAPDIWRSVAYIDLRNYCSSMKNPTPKIIFHTRQNIDLIFSPLNPTKQILRIAFLLHSRLHNSLNIIKQIDISSGDAIVTYR